MDGTWSPCAPQKPKKAPPEFASRSAWPTVSSGGFQNCSCMLLFSTNCFFQQHPPTENEETSPWQSAGCRGVRFCLFLLNLPHCPRHKKQPMTASSRSPVHQNVGIMLFVCATAQNKTNTNVQLYKNVSLFIFIFPSHAGTVIDLYTCSISMGKISLQGP